MHARTANQGLVVVHMDRAQGPTVDFFSQNLCATHTERAKSSGSPCVAAAAGLRGADGPAREHLATDVEAALRASRNQKALLRTCKL